jgi:hypothetical protein
MPKRKRAGAAAAAPAVRICRRCGATDAIAAFTPRANICRPCDAARARDRYWRDVDASRRRQRERRQRHLEIERARGRANAKSAHGREINRAAVARYAARCPEKIAARSAVTSAVKRGLVKRATCCEVSGCTRNERLQAHHHSYRKPRDVVFLCHLHHEAVHHEGPQRLKPGGKRKFARPPRLAVRTRKAA